MKSAVDANAVLRRHLAQRKVDRVADLASDEIVALALQFAIWIPQRTYQAVPWLAPYAIRRLRKRTEPNAPGPKRDLWGVPTADGFFTDDNSLIKAVVLRHAVRPVPNPYGGQAITKGLVCCHVWPATTGDPLLFSFVPILVWLPRDLATYSDAHRQGPPHRVHEMLKGVAVHRYRGLPTATAPDRVEAAWSRLDVVAPIAVEHGLEFEVGDSLIGLVASRISKLDEFLDTALNPGGAPLRRFSRRYHAGGGPGADSSVWPIQHWVSRDALQQLRDEMSACRPAPTEQTQP